MQGSPITAGNDSTPPARKGQVPDGTVITVSSGAAFRVVACSGTDLYGEVYRGEPAAAEAAGEAVCIKLLDPEIYGKNALPRLLADAELVRGLSHKNLLAVHGVCRLDQQVLLVTDAPLGQSLRQMIEKKQKAQGQPLSIKGAYNVAAHLCNLLTYVHGALPHGAVCPECIDVVVQTGHVRIADLVPGRFVSTERFQRLLPGSAACLAPERLGGGPPSVAADIYAIGAILFECLTMQPLPSSHEGDEGKAQTSRLLRTLLPPIASVIHRAISPDPGQRHQSPQELKAELAAAVEGPKGTASIPLRALSDIQARDKDGPKVSEQLPVVLSKTAAPPLPTTPTAAVATPTPQVKTMADTPQKGPFPLPPAAPKGPAPSRPSFPPGPPVGSAGGFPMPPPPLASGPPSGQQAGGVDEDHERWLIQKEDKMDYGPFPLREVRSQIEKGTISADHMILDMETGDRRRVREHALLGGMAREWEGRHAQTAMELRDQAERAKHRASIQKSLSGIFIALILIGAGVGGYFKFFYKPMVKTVVVKEQSSDDFFKGVQISMKVDPPVKRTHTPGKHRGKMLKNGQFDESINLGDADQEGGDETLTGEQVQGVMNQNFKLLGGCLKEESQRNPGVKKLDLEFLIRGTGAVSSVKVNGETGSAVASCVFAKMQAVTFPKFNGQKTHAAFSLALR